MKHVWRKSIPSPERVFHFCILLASIVFLTMAGWSAFEQWGVMKAYIIPLVLLFTGFVVYIWTSCTSIKELGKLIVLIAFASWLLLLFIDNWDLVADAFRDIIWKCREGLHFLSHPELYVN